MLFPQPELSAHWQADYVCAGSWDELERARLTTRWPRRAVLPEMRAEPGVNAALYRQTVVVPLLIAGQRRELSVGAAMLATRIWINGQFAGEHWGGYTPFAFDISALLRAGENEIVIGVRGEDATFFDGGRAARCAIGVSALMLDATGRERWSRQFGLAAPCPRFGVTQAVRLVCRPREDIEDVFVYAGAGLTALEIELAHTFAKSPAWDLALYSARGEKIASRRVDGGARLSWPGPQLQPWSPEQPHLYFLEVRAVERPEAVRRVRFGWRTFAISGADFLLNGRKVVLRGESDLFQNQGYQFHDPHGLDISALQRPDEVKTYLAGLKRELGVNAFRQHAAIGAPAVFAAADEVGLLVLNQSSVWSRGFPFYLAGGETFIEQTSREFGAWIRRDRNHPSVVIWGVENEMLRIGSAQPDACVFFQRLEKPIAELDPTRPRTFDGGAAVPADAQVHHVHHEENYDVLLREWRRDKPLVFGEFWIGGRNAERRLTNAYEFSGAADYWPEMNRLWARKIVGLRLGGASGVMPYNFSAQILRSAERKQRRAADGGGSGWSESWLNAAGAASSLELDAGARALLRHALGPCLVEFATRQQAFYLSEKGAVELPVVVRNDTETKQTFSLRWSVEHAVAGELSFAVGAGEEWRGRVALAPESCEVATVRLTLATRAAGEVDAAGQRFYFAKKTPAPLALRRPVYFVRDAAVTPYVEQLARLGLVATEWVGGAQAVSLDGALVIATPGAMAALLTANPSADLRGFVVEGEGTFPGWLGTGGIHDLKQPYLHSNHFARVIGRELQIDDLYHPNESMVEDFDHPALARWPERRFTGFDDAESDVLTRGVIVHPELTLQNIMGDMKNVGAGMNLGEGDGAVAQTAHATAFRPLLSSSRREYASLAEVAVGRGLLLVNRLRLGTALGRHPWADALWTDALHWLDAAPARESAVSSVGVVVCDASRGALGGDAWPAAQVVVVHNLENAGDAFFEGLRAGLGAVRKVTPSDPANHVAVEQGGFFAASKSAGILRTPLPFASALEWNDASAVVGAWRLLQCDESFEVKGHAFPWSWRSDFPKFLGYAALHLHRHGRDWLLLLEDLTKNDPAVAARYQTVLANVRRARETAR